MSPDISKLSVVIASASGFPIIGECLDSLKKQPEIAELEVVVANRCINGVVQEIKEKYPWVKLIQAPQDTTVPELRSMAIHEATGDIVAVLDDHLIVDRDWAKRMIDAHRTNHPVIGGTLKNAADTRLVDWAAFFCEYSEVMDPVPEGEAEFIAGSNVTYKRWVLERFREQIEAGVWDTILHEQIKKAGIPLYSKPSITVQHKMSASLGWFMAQKFHFARSFSGSRFEDPSRLRRAVYGAGSVFLPFVLARRIFSRVWSKGTHRRELVLSFPFLLLLLLSGAIGESFGYILGAGSSNEKVA